jgi:hypothetical protein
MVLAALCMLVALSLAYVSGISWQQKADALQVRVTGGRAAAIETFAPSRRVTRVVENRYVETARTLVLDGQNPFAAEFAGRAFSLVWYDPQLQRWTKEANADGTGQAWVAVFERTGANLLLTARDRISPALMAAITTAKGSVVYEGGGSLLWQIDRSTPGVASLSAPHGLSVSFDAMKTPPAETLVDASVMLRCDPELARKGHIVVSWQINQDKQPPYRKYQWAACLQNGTAHTSINVALPHKVTAKNVLFKPEPAMDMRLAVQASQAVFRRDLAAERDMSQPARRVLGFWLETSARQSTP